MPITPLHLGLLAPVNHFAPGKFSNVSFVIISLWMDGNTILYYLFNLQYVDHGPTTHSFVAALVGAFIVALPGLWVRKWVLGAFYGGLTHVPLDMLVHAEMEPFYPLPGNPFHIGHMDMVSLLLLPLFVWLVAQYVSTMTAWVRKQWREAVIAVRDGGDAERHRDP